MNENTKQDGGATTPEIIITGRTAHLIQTCARMVGRTVDETLAEWAQATIECELDAAFNDGDGRAVLIGSHALPDWNLEVVNDRSKSGHPITRENAAKLLELNPQATLRATKPETPTA